MPSICSKTCLWVQESQKPHVRRLCFAAIVLLWDEMERGRSGDCAQSTYPFSQYWSLGTVLEQDRPIWISYCCLTCHARFYLYIKLRSHPSQRTPSELFYALTDF